MMNRASGWMFPAAALFFFVYSGLFSSGASFPPSQWNLPFLQAAVFWAPDFMVNQKLGM